MTSAPGLVQRGDPLEALLQQLLDVAELGRDPALREVEDDLLGTVDEDLRLARPLPAELGDLLTGGDEAAQRRHLADDARVVRRVRGRRHERRKLVEADSSADILELAALLELVDERDRVDRLALRVERECRAVDLRVALAVEVGRVEDLAHRPDRARGEQHRPEDGLLGLEVLGWRDRSGFSELGDRCHARGAEAPPVRCCQVCGRGRFSTCRIRGDLQGKRTHVPIHVRTESVDSSAAPSGKFVRSIHRAVERACDRYTQAFHKTAHAVTTGEDVRRDRPDCVFSAAADGCGHAAAAGA